MTQCTRHEIEHIIDGYEASLTIHYPTADISKSAEYTFQYLSPAHIVECYGDTPCEYPQDLVLDRDGGTYACRAEHHGSNMWETIGFAQNEIEAREICQAAALEMDY